MGSSDDLRRIVLGGAQWGLNYGIKHQSRGGTILAATELRKIILIALSSGIQAIDLAQAYGSAERRFAAAYNYLYANSPKIRYNLTEMRIFTKLLFAADQNPWLIFSQSLKVHPLRPYALMFHSFTNFREDESLLARLRKWREQGLVQKIGFSLYYPEELEYLLEKKLEFDFVQLPYNIFDQRFAPYFAVLSEYNIDLYCRSVFLQGILLMAPSAVPLRLRALKDRLYKLLELSRNSALDPASLALLFALRTSPGKLVLGVQNSTELKQNIKSIQAAKYASIENHLPALSRLKVEDYKLLIPTFW